MRLVRRFVATLGLVVFSGFLPPVAAADVGRWRPAGPAVPVNFISVDPSRPRIVYATGAGVHRSDDSGDTWELVTSFHIDVLVVDPGNSSILYGSSSDPQRNVFKSTDSGRTWMPSSAGLPAFAWLRLYVAGPEHVYGFDSRGVWETRDAAATWSLTSSGIFGSTALGIDPTNTRRVYVSDQFGHIFRSDDGGASWTQSPGTVSHPKTSIAVNPLDPSHIFAAVTCCNEIAFSQNFGESWVPVRVPANRATSVLAEPNGNIFIGTGPGACPGPCPPEPTGVFRSSDEGATWEPLNEGLGYRSVRHLLSVGNGTRLIAVTDGGDLGTFVYDLGLVAEVPDISGWAKGVFALLLVLAGLTAIRIRLGDHT